MKKIISILAAVFISPLICQSLHAEDADRKLKEAIKVISNPETHSRPKHEAMVTLQELKDVRSIDALYEQIDFASNWGNPLQKGTTNTYPATNALIVIGLPSIKGAERFVSSGRSLNKDQLWLTTYVVGTIFQVSTKEEPGSQYPKARKMTLDWIKKNFTVPQMKKAAERYSPDLEEYLATLPNDPITDDSKMPPQIGDSEEDPKATIMEQELSSEKNTPDQSSSTVPASKQIPATTTQITKSKSIWWLVIGGVLLAFLALLCKVWKNISSE